MEEVGRRILGKVKNGTEMMEIKKMNRLVGKFQEVENRRQR